MTTSQHRGRKRSAARFSRAVALFATAVATTLVAAGAGAIADPANTSHVDVVTAAVAAGGIAVAGQATFVDVPGVVGDDATDDAVPPAAPLGHELTTATISRPDPFADMLRFTLKIANQPPAINGVPEFVVYRWTFTVTMGGTKQRDVTLRAWRSSQYQNRGSADPYFVLDICEPTGGCLNRVLTGSMGDGLVAWNVPLGQDIDLGQIGQVGGVITSADGIKVMSSASGAFSRNIGFGDDKTDEVVVLDETTIDTAYTVPGPVVRIGIAPAGTAPEDVPLTAAGTVNSQGAFNGRLPTPDTPGEYTIVARACHGTDSCGLAATRVTV